MSLFGEQPEPATTRPRSRRVTLGWTFLIAAIVAALVMSFLPAPYVIEQPGPVFNTLGTQDQDGNAVELITIEGRQTYPTGGTLDMLTVSAIGNPSQSPSWAQVVSAWFDPTKAVVPMWAIYPKGTTTEQRNQQNAQDMTNSQQEAIAAALHQLDIPFTTELAIGSVATGGPADGVLVPGDIVISANGTPITAVDQLRAVITENGTDKPASLVVRHEDGTEETLEITPQYSDAIQGPAIGVGGADVFEFPFDVDIQLDDVGGPSAGMMFALGIIDKLTPGELNGGQSIAGTGTIDAAGTVGAIGGIRQKMVGARDAGAQYFLAPAANCDEVVGHIPDGLSVFKVSTLDDAMTVLQTIESGGDLSSLPTCDATASALSDGGQ
ncbi:ATP-dependent serine peptidase containing a PDZ domain protein [Humibacter sp. BT305]|uniref:endopeptidase La n=1 Tax=Cnuibacter physcomitrellae TaxID=1619308 RepID=A0A1X9LVJ9_9MICO|nr:S16 family serine protease [Cnuibacter physcomitrellae]ARJ07329.1 ATP-dependent serine peptidase containing a PDZ domain protein [Cnuibacter physcomitrellae]AXH37284.1 ATP-dependent serine peptidase containing a PDZ domain protein [Humibacter sp. BT305]GGI36254.1 hypothetical protein GCM10010988_08030 [Cnuibacter physcomitrellae]